MELPARDEFFAQSTGKFYGHGREGVIGGLGILSPELTLPPQFDPRARYTVCVVWQNMSFREGETDFPARIRDGASLIPLGRRPPDRGSPSGGRERVIGGLGTSGGTGGAPACLQFLSPLPRQAHWLRSRDFSGKGPGDGAAHRGVRFMQQST